MKKYICAIATFSTTMRLLIGCGRPAIHAGKAVGSGFLSIPVKQPYMPAIGFDICLCQHVKHDFSAQADDKR